MQSTNTSNTFIHFVDGLIQGEMLKTGHDVAFCSRVTKQEYEEQKKFETQRSLEELLRCIVEQENVSKKDRRKMLKQV